ncbi:MAG TPA: DUF1178 family protein, partial [Sphingomicrobium sp.]|nr:DUF1178 family protein [Sphingomicrobium sp.]
YDLQCEDSGDLFEAWFRSGADFDNQSARGLVQCPVCQSTRVAKAPMAPRVPSRSRDRSSPIARLAALQAAMLKDSEWVGDRFAEEARSMHLGEADVRPVHGNATASDAKSLIDDGIPVAPLPLPVVPPNQVN